MTKLTIGSVVFGAVAIACGGKVYLGDASDETTLPSTYGDNGPTETVMFPHPSAPNARDKQPSKVNEAAEDEYEDDGPEVSPDSPTYVTGPLGFTVRDAVAFYGRDYAFHTCTGDGPGNPPPPGLLLTSFVGACDISKAKHNSRILRIDFTAAAGQIPGPGSYPLLEQDAEPLPVGTCAAVQRVWGDCATVGYEGAAFTNGFVELSKSDENGMEGTLEITTPNGVVSGRFVAPRCDNDKVCSIF